MITSPYNSAIEVTRTLVLLEDKPTSGEYSEVMLTHEQANKVRDLLQEFMPARNDGMLIPMSAETVKIEWARGEYTQEQITETLTRGT